MSFGALLPDPPAVTKEATSQDSSMTSAFDACLWGKLVSRPRAAALPVEPTCSLQPYKPGGMPWLLYLCVKFLGER